MQRSFRRDWSYRRKREIFSRNRLRSRRLGGGREGEGEEGRGGEGRGGVEGTEGEGGAEGREGKGVYVCGTQALPYVYLLLSC